MKRHEVIRERGAATAEAQRQAADLRAAVREALRGSAYEYLTCVEAAAHLKFDVTCRKPVAAFREWARVRRVPKYRRGKFVLFLRKDLDQAVKPQGQPRRFFSSHRRAS